MLVVERTVVVRRHTEVIVAQRILRLVEDTPVGQDAHRQAVGVIWVSVEVLIGIADDGVLHRTIGQRLVGVILDVVLLRGRSVLEGTEHR